MTAEIQSEGKITFGDFDKVDIRVGQIIKVEEFPRARKPAFKLWIDFGPLGVKKSSAQITRLYEMETLLNKRVVAVVNFPVKQIADFHSEVLVLGAATADGAIALLSADFEVPLGARIC